MRSITQFFGSTRTRVSPARPASRPAAAFVSIGARPAAAGSLTLSLITAMTLVLAGCGGRSSVRLPDYNSDPMITQRVHDALNADPALANALREGEIKVVVAQGSVTLSGDLPTVADVSHALSSVRTVGGVSAVQSDLHVSAPVSTPVPAQPELQPSAQPAASAPSPAPASTPSSTTLRTE